MIAIPTLTRINPKRIIMREVFIGYSIQQKSNLSEEGVLAIE